MSDTLNLANSIWPNTGGTLGEIKTQIPDGVTIKWPDGDALVGNFVYKDGNLVGLVDTKALIENDSKTTVFPYDYVNITLDKRLESIMTFEKGERCKFFNINHEVMLPEGYKRLAYLESTGKQYIDTGIKLSSESEVRCGVAFTSMESFNYVFGGMGEVWLNEGFYVLCINSQLLAGYATQDRSKGLPVVQYELYNTKLDKNEFDVNGTQIYAFKPDGSGFTEQPVTCWVFGFRRGPNYGGVPQICRVYSFTISRAGEMQLYFIPCLDPNGTPCMYDIMSQEPFYNDGTGQFLYPGAESQVVTSDLDEIFYAKKTAHGIQKLYHIPENFSGSKDEYAIENGFKQLVEPPMPTEGHWIPEWIETDTQLICNWVEADISEI